MNARMVKALRHGFVGDLPPQLIDVVQGGFVEQGGCWLLRGLPLGAGNASLSDFPDKTGYECFVNSLHISDYAAQDFLAVGISFADALFSVWNCLHACARLNLIISDDDGDVVVRCHLLRKDEIWVAPDLDAYGEALMVADSSVGVLSGSLLDLGEGLRSSGLR